MNANPDTLPKKLTVIPFRIIGREEEYHLHAFPSTKKVGIITDKAVAEEIEKRWHGFADESPGSLRSALRHTDDQYREALERAGRAEMVSYNIMKCLSRLMIVARDPYQTPRALKEQIKAIICNLRLFVRDHPKIAETYTCGFCGEYPDECTKQECPHKEPTP